MSFFRIKTRKADSLFSKYIRERDNWTCLRCGKQHDKASRNFGVSHYFGRRKESVRFDPDNCISLCNIPCHQLWGHGEEREQYKEFMINWLGEYRFNLLKIRADTIGRKDDKLAILKINEMTRELKNEMETDE